MRETDQRIRPAALDGAVGQLVRASHVARDSVQTGKVASKRRRKFADHPAVRGIDVRLVDGAPQSDQVPKLIDNSMHKRHECVRRAGGRPPALAGEPQRAREMVQRDHGLHALLAQLAQDVAVMPDLARVELARGRLDARPLERQPMGVLLHLAKEREILAVPVVVIAGDRRGIAVRDSARLLFELPPIAVAIVSLDLVGGTGGTPQEPVWESPSRCSHEVTALAGVEILGGGK